MRSTKLYGYMNEVINPDVSAVFLLKVFCLTRIMKDIQGDQKSLYT
jgi:hypothetical protein